MNIEFNTCIIHRGLNTNCIMFGAHVLFGELVEFQR